MSVFRVHKSKDFTVMSNHHLRNKELSLKAKGLLTVMLSLPDEWDYSVLGLASLSKDGKDAVMSALNELTATGYVEVNSCRNEKGQYESIYNVYEYPNRENRCGKSESENPTQYNIKDNSTENNYDNNKDSSSRIINNTSNNLSSIPKKVKKGLDLSFVGTEFQDMFERYIEYRKEVRKPLTQSSSEAAYRKLLMLSNQEARVADEIIEQSIANGWTGLFELKQQNQNNYGHSSSSYQPTLLDQFTEQLKASGQF